MTPGVENIVTQEKQLTTAVGRCYCSSHNKAKRCVAAYRSLSNTINTAISLPAEYKRTKAGENERSSDFQMAKKAMDSKATTVRNI